jgi:hypothetical protein
MDNLKRKTDSIEWEKMIIEMASVQSAQVAIVARVEASLDHHKERDEKKQVTDDAWRKEVLAEVAKCSEEGRVKDLQEAVTDNSNKILKIDASLTTVRNVYGITLAGVAAIFGALRLFR